MSEEEKGPDLNGQIFCSEERSIYTNATYFHMLNINNDVEMDGKIYILAGFE